MEYVTVRFPEERTVFVDGGEGGLTNVMLRTNAGTHTFHLGEPRDYRPAEIKIHVVGTTAIWPLEVTFEKA